MGASLHLADVVERFLSAHQSQHPLNRGQAKALGSIRCCRTAQLGGQELQCQHCGYNTVQYHSCRNRHCPKCQYQASEKWRERQRSHLLPIPYHHIVFTLPHELTRWAPWYRELLYRCLFKAAWSTLKRFGEDPKRLNGKLGMTAVLHTWGQNLDQHIHLHCLVPGGALNVDNDEWHSARSNYLFPVRALSRCFRGCFVSAIRDAQRSGELEKICKKDIDETLDKLMEKEWAIYSKSTHIHADSIIDYLSQYTFRIAISEHRLVDMDDEYVRFRWKDYAAHNKHKIMRLKGAEFVRRFLLHILPSGFMRIRHFGFLANCHREEKLKQIRRLLLVSEDDAAITVLSNTVSTKVHEQKLLASRCPVCRTLALFVISEVKAKRRQSH